MTELEWPVEMIQETSTQPPVAWSCNPLAFDFTQLFMKPTKPKKLETTGQGDQDVKPSVEGPSSVDNGKYKMVENGILFLEQDFIFHFNGVQGDPFR